MKRNYWKILLLIICIFTISITKVEAISHEAVIDRYNFSIPQQPNQSVLLGNAGLDFRGYNSTSYEFFDSNGNYNVIFTLYRDSGHIGWFTISSDFKRVISEKYIETRLSKFGNAIYKDGYLYVVYGAKDTTTTDESADNFASTITIEIVKYDSDGNIVKDLALPGYETGTGTANSLAKSEGTKSPFSSGQCSLDINKDGIMKVLFNREMYNGHVSSYSMLIDTKDLNYLTRPSTMTVDNKYSNILNHYWVSHSLEERVMAASDGHFVMVDQGDGFPRAFRLTKDYDMEDGRKDLDTYDVFHFREGDDSNYGYNYTYASLGNIIELSDGYLMVATSEPTLSLNYAKGRSINEGRDIFIQKYSKDLRDKNRQTIQLFNTPERIPNGPRTDTPNKGLFLVSANVKDYGVKWLTKSGNEKTISEVRATSIDNDRVMILWAEANIIEISTGGYKRDGNYKYYYMIIDNNGNIIIDKTVINKALLTNNMNYIYKNGYLYWAEIIDNNMAINKLNIEKRNEETTFTTNTDKEIIITDVDIKTYQIDVATNKDVNIIWESRNKNVATVDSNGKLTILNNGHAMITATLEGYKLSLTWDLKVFYQAKKVIPKYNEVYMVKDAHKFIPIDFEPANVFNTKIDWKSSDETVFVIENSYYTGAPDIKSVGIGDAKLTGVTTDGSNITVSIDIHVVTPYDSIKINEETLDLHKGQTANLTYTASPSTSKMPVKWESGNQKVVTVDDNGKVTAVGNGKTNICVRGVIGSSSNCIDVTVDYYVTGIYVPNEIFIPIGGNIDYAINPSGHGESTRIGIICDNKVVKADRYGNLVAVGKGTTDVTISVYCYESDKTFTKTVKVTVGDYLKGDVNKDGKITLADVIKELKVYLELEDKTEYVSTVGDMNNDGNISIADVITILKLYLEIE